MTHTRRLIASEHEVLRIVKAQFVKAALSIAATWATIVVLIATCTSTAELFWCQMIAAVLMMVQCDVRLGMQSACIAATIILVYVARRLKVLHTLVECKVGRIVVLLRAHFVCIVLDAQADVLLARVG